MIPAKKGKRASGVSKEDIRNKLHYLYAITSCKSKSASPLSPRKLHLHKHGTPFSIKSCLTLFWPPLIGRWKESHIKSVQVISFFTVASKQLSCIFLSKPIFWYHFKPCCSVQLGYCQKVYPHL